jgi:hypothetical protein
LSLYRYLNDIASDRGHAFGASAAERRLAARGLDAFLDVVPRRDLLNQLYMFSRAFDLGEAARRIAGCSLVFMVDDMATGVELLSRVIGQELPVRNERASTPGVQPSEEQLDRLHSMLALEYALLDRLRPRLEQTAAALAY